MAFSFESRIRYSEVDQNAKLTWIKLLDYFQDVTSFQSEEIDLGVEFLAKKQIAWVLNSWQICVERMPHLNEEVVITTIPYELKGFFGLRNFVMETKAGERIACANSIWTLIDLKSNRPTKVLPEMEEKYGLGERIEMDYCERKLRIPEELKELDTIPVTHHLIDTNGHVNNGRYVELAMEYLPTDMVIQEVRAEYKMQAKEGDTLYAWINEDASKTTVVLADEEKKPYATVQFLL